MCRSLVQVRFGVLFFPLANLLIRRLLWHFVLRPPEGTAGEATEQLVQHWYCGGANRWLYVSCDCSRRDLRGAVELDSDNQVSTLSLKGAFLIRYHREELFTILTGLAFVFALISTLMSAFMHGLVNMGGNEQVVKTVRKWCVAFGIPLYLLVVAVFLLLVSAFFAVGGRYQSRAVWLSIVIAGGVLTFIMTSIFCVMIHGVYLEIDRHLEQFQKNQRALASNAALLASQTTHHEPVAL